MTRLSELQDAAQGGLDLSLAIERAQALEQKGAELDRARARLADSADDERCDALNAGLLSLTRILNPVLYTEAGEFDQDPAIQLPMLPGLRRAKNLPEHQPGTRERLFLSTALMRQRNRVDHALQRANEEAEALLGRL